MIIQVNTDNHIQGDERLEQSVEAAVAASLDRFGDRVTRVEVHLSDSNSQKGGVDKRCTMEVRLEGLRPLAVTHDAETVEQAVQGAAHQLEKAVGNFLGRLKDSKGHGRGGSGDADMP